MIYKIFEIDIKGELSDTYGRENESIHRIVTPQGLPYEMRNEFQYFNEAYLEIEKYADKLKHKMLTIIPIIDINWEGKIQEAWPPRQQSQD